MKKVYNTKVLPIKVWIPMWLALPPVGTEFLFRNKYGRTITGVRSKGDKHVTTADMNEGKTQVVCWRFKTPSEVHIPAWAKKD